MFSCQVLLFCFIGLCSYTGISINFWGLISFFSYVKCRFPLPPCSFPFSWLLLLFFLYKSFRFDLSDSVFIFSPWDWIKYINSGKVEISDIDYSLLWKLSMSFYLFRSFVSFSGILKVSVHVYIYLVKLIPRSFLFSDCWKWYFFLLYINLLMNGIYVKFCFSSLTKLFYCFY